MKIRLGLGELKMSDVAQYCEGTLCENTNTEASVRYVCTDSREADRETMFVATRGERVDGHDYILSAIENGCECVLCEYIPEGARDKASFVTVKDSVEAFSLCAKGYRKSAPIKTVAITGSVGKTTTKELCAAIIRRERSLYATEGNFNSVIGMPMSLMAVGEDKDSAVFEMGMSGFGEIRSMTRAATPLVAMVINVGSSHLEYLKTRDNIALAKLEIAEGLRAGGVLLLNGDEPLLRKHVKAGDYKTVYVGTENGEDCEIVVENIRVGEDGTRFDLVFFGERIDSLKINLIGKQFATNAAFAASASLLMGISQDAVRLGLCDYVPSSMRQNIYEKDGVRVISDCYNAAPESMRAAIDTLCAIKTDGNRIAVLGDMRELGEDSVRMHREIGEYAAKTGVDMIFTLGEFGAKIAEAARISGIDAQNIYSEGDTENTGSLSEAIKERMRAGDVILFKASRGVRLERVIDLLSLEKE